MVNVVKGEAYWRGSQEWRRQPAPVKSGRVTVGRVELSRIESGVHVASGITAAAGGSLALYSLGNNIMGAVRAKEGSERAKFSGKAILSAAKVTDASGDITNSLAKLGFIARAAAAWTTVLGYIILPFQAIGLTLNVYDTVQHGKCLHKLNTIDNKASQEMRVLTGLEIVKEKDKERVDAIMQRIRTAEGGEKALALEEGEQLLALLKTRVKKDLATSVACTALGIISVACAIFAIVASGGLALVAAGVAVGVVGLGVTLFKYWHDKQVREEQVRYQRQAIAIG